MKNLLFILLFTIFSLNSFSQDSFPLIEENKTWNVISVILTGSYPGDTSFSTLTYEFNGDTIIESKTYKKLYRSNEENPQNWTLDSFMRESDKKVWYRYKTDNDEFLMYDFSLEVGDSILDQTGTAYLFIDSINYVTIGQTDRKKYWLSLPEDPEFYNETWIDGIGSSKGICFSGTVLFVGGWTWFLCASESGELVYMNPNYESCYLITELDEIKNPIIEIYPNPAKNILRIDNRKMIEFESISITNINGQVIKQFDKEINQLDISEIASGLYFLIIKYENGNFTEKVIID